MKVKRFKGAKKIINFYKNSFGIFEPYQVLIDLTFCNAALQGKVLLKEQIPKYFDAQVQLGTNNPNRYFVATQDRELQTHLKTIPGVPVMYLNHNCMVLEKPSALSSKTAQEVQDSRINPTTHEKVQIDKLKGTLPESEQKGRRKRKRLGGPNPLSVMKKKRKTDTKISSSKEKVILSDSLSVFMYSCLSMSLYDCLGYYHLSEFLSICLAFRM
ncbi:hypothetical protein QZH41_014515 [Actinostola sp. cb2023]|nr:hypothetical protein QZH41_014515 [Actinostola sp. cb2023]